MPIKAYRVLTKRHLALAVMAVFLTALAVIVAAALIPYAYANASCRFTVRIAPTRWCPLPSMRPGETRIRRS